jgi:guanine deaminase
MLKVQDSKLEANSVMTLNFEPGALNSPAQPAFMQEAIRLAIDGVSAGKGGPFGAVVVKAGQIVGRGCNQVTSTNDPTAHAEMVAIRDACKNLGSFHLHECELYASCEPCPMCLAAIYWARLERYYYACTATDAAAIGFSDELICRQLALPLDLRSVAAIQFLRPAALAALAAWQAKADRTPY